MEQIDVNPHEIGVWNGHIRVHEESLVEIIEREGWVNTPRVPIFELPKGLNHRYVLIDGHARHDAAIKKISLLPCNLYLHDERIDVVRDKLAPFRYQDKVSFEKILCLYLLYEQSPALPTTF